MNDDFPTFDRPPDRDLGQAGGGSWPGRPAAVSKRAEVTRTRRSAVSAAAPDRRPSARRRTRIWIANCSQSAPFCSDSTIIGALSFDFCVKLTTVPCPSDDGVSLYSDVMSASLKSIDLRRELLVLRVVRVLGADVLHLEARGQHVEARDEVEHSSCCHSPRRFRT
jgi:hypothetical protein